MRKVRVLKEALQARHWKRRGVKALWVWEGSRLKPFSSRHINPIETASLVLHSLLFSTSAVCLTNHCITPMMLMMYVSASPKSCGRTMPWAATANSAVAVRVREQMKSRRKPTQRAVEMTALKGGGGIERIFQKNARGKPI